MTLVSSSAVTGTKFILNGVPLLQALPVLQAMESAVPSSARSHIWSSIFLNSAEILACWAGCELVPEVQVHKVALPDLPQARVKVLRHFRPLAGVAGVGRGHTTVHHAVAQGGVHLREQA